VALIWSPQAASMAPLPPLAASGAMPSMRLALKGSRLGRTTRSTSKAYDRSGSSPNWPSRMNFCASASGAFGGTGATASPRLFSGHKDLQGERHLCSAAADPPGVGAFGPLASGSGSGQVNGFPALRGVLREALQRVPLEAGRRAAFPLFAPLIPRIPPGLGRGLPSCGFFPLFSVICPGLGPTRTPLVKPRRGIYDWSPRASARGGHGQEAATR
jgi:hypothetical protein